MYSNCNPFQLILTLLLTCFYLILVMNVHITYLLVKWLFRAACWAVGVCHWADCIWRTFIAICSPLLHNKSEKLSINHELNLNKSHKFSGSCHQQYDSSRCVHVDETPKLREAEKNTSSHFTPHPLCSLYRELLNGCTEFMPNCAIKWWLDAQLARSWGQVWPEIRELYAFLLQAW